MYRVYIENMLLPIAPQSIKISNTNQNTTVSLVSDEQFNVLKVLGLTDYQFSFILPKFKYHFAFYENNIFRDPSWFLAKLLYIKANKTVVDFTVITDDGNMDFTNKKVTIEDFTVSHAVQNFEDIVVNISLKEYVHHETKLVSINEKAPTTSVTRPSDPTANMDTYTIKSGDTLTAIAKRFYNDLSYIWVIYKLNKTLLDSIAVSRGFPRESGHWWIFPGTVINLP